MFVTAPICNRFMFWHKKLGPAQNILGPVKGQGITVARPLISICINSIFQTYEAPRAREVGQSWFTSFFFTIYAFLCCLSIIWRTRPKLVLVNGPGTCVPIVIATRFLSVGRLFKTQIVFVESICRVKTLSMSAKLLMTFKMLDVIIVQWPELALKYPHTKYIGKMF